MFVNWRLVGRSSSVSLGGSEQVAEGTMAVGVGRMAGSDLSKAKQWHKISVIWN